jgi:hypothetical protein
MRLDKNQLAQLSASLLVRLFIQATVLLLMSLLGVLRLMPLIVSFQLELLGHGATFM